VRAARRLRELINGPGMVEVPGVHDVLSARIAERMGFRALYVGSSLVAAASHGLPDIGIVSPGEFIEHGRRLAGAVDIPVILDLDDAGGTPLKVARAVRAAEQAGIAGFHIEDLATSVGKHFVDTESGGYDFGRERLVPVEVAAANIRAAVAARRDPATVVIGRTDAAAVTSVDDAIERANAYAEAGADLLKFAHLELADLERVAKSVRKPLMYYSLRLPPEEKLTAERVGVKIRFHPFASLIPAMHAVEAELRTLRDTGVLPELDTIPSYAVAQDYVGAAEWAALARTHGMPV
jgi:methylisocitrate lyase